MKHLKLFENFTVEKDLFTEITEEEYEERNVDRFDTNSQILKYLNVLKSKYNSYLEADSMIVDIIEKRRDGTNGDNKLELTINLTDDDWFIVRMDEYAAKWLPDEWMGSWIGREVDDDYTEPSYWKCDQIEGLIAFIDVVKEDIWGFLTR